MNGEAIENTGRNSDGIGKTKEVEHKQNMESGTGPEVEKTQQAGPGPSNIPMQSTGEPTMVIMPEPSNIPVQNQSSQIPDSMPAQNAENPAPSGAPMQNAAGPAQNANGTAGWNQAQNAGATPGGNQAQNAGAAAGGNQAQSAGAAAGWNQAQNAGAAPGGNQAQNANLAAGGSRQQGSLNPQNVNVPVNTAGHQNVPPSGNSGGGTGRAGRIAFVLSVLLVLAILGGMYAYGYDYCSKHFMPGTQINGYDCSRMTEEEVEAKFADAAKEYVINVRFRGGATEILHAQDIGFAYKSDGSIAALLQHQDCLVWPKYLFEDNLYEIKPGGTYDDEMLTKALQKLPELQEDNMEKPKDAYIQFKDGDEETDGTFEIIPETKGSTIDIVQLAAGVGDAAARYQEMVDAEEIGGAYVEASMKADNAKIIARCNDLNDLVGASITYELPDGDTIRLNSDVMKDWLVKDKKGRLVRDDEVWDQKLWEFLENLAANANTIGLDRQFYSSLRGLITVSGGDYGYMVNQITEHDKLVEDIKKKKKETRKPDYYISPYNEETENDGIGTTYIEVDLSAQHIWCYVQGQLVMESDCVSGDTTTGHGTPTGVFGIMFMQRDTTLRGVMQSNGKYEYETKVGYWMPFYDGCGFHDAWWRNAFGGTIYKGDGSHGCVNLPVSAAESLYSYCEDKMPVVVYW